MSRLARPRNVDEEVAAAVKVGGSITADRQPSAEEWRMLMAIAMDVVATAQLKGASHSQFHGFVLHAIRTSGRQVSLCLSGVDDEEGH